MLKAHGITPAWDTATKRLTSAARAQLAAIDLHWHDLRHDAGSRLVEKGWPIYAYANLYLAAPAAIRAAWRALRHEIHVTRKFQTSALWQA